MALLPNERTEKISHAAKSNNATVEELMSSVAAMAPLISRHIREIEQNRRIPDEIVRTLKSARVFSTFVPKRYQGLELDGPSALRAVTALSKLDGAVGWNVMISLIGSLVAFLTTPTLCDQIFGDGQDHIFAGSNRPSGNAVRASGGWHVSGVWPFASSCEHADWILGNCILKDGDSPIPSVSGDGPITRACLIPASLWEIMDTWNVVGLKGTGSHHVSLRDVFVADTNFFEFPFGPPIAPEPAFGKVPELMVLLHSAFAVGVAEGAMDDVIALAGTGVTQQFARASLAETDRFNDGLARLHAELQAAQALLAADADRVWHACMQPKVRDMSQIAELRGHAGWIASACVRVADSCFELAGCEAVYETAPLQRRMRDLQVGAQHASVHPRNFVAAGAAILERHR